MSDGYKNILANGYMRDTNYIIIKDCDNIDELNIQWNKFLSNMTVRQQRLSDDKSIEIWNITNQQHYEIQKQQFLEKLKKKNIEGNKEIIPSNIVDLNDDTPDSIFSSGDFDEFKKDIDLNDPKYYTEDNNINLTLPDDIKDDPNDNAMEFNQDSTMSIVGNIAGNNVEDKLKNLEKEFIKFNSQSNDIKRKADDKCRELYGGSSNLDRYNKLKSEYLSNKTKDDLEPKDFIPSIEPQDNSDNDEIKCNEKICRYHCNDSSAVTEALHNDSFIARCYSAYILNSINEASDHKEMKRLEDVPYFTPQELIDLGVHGNNNYYSKMSDNDGLTKDISISTWFDSYKDLSMNHIFEDYRKEWINKLNELYSDYYDIRDEDKLLARKQSILDLGWNPEIPFTNENRIKASNRVNEILKQTTPNDIFIDMSNIPESDDYLSESIDTSYEPVFLVLTKGKTPVISQGIKFVTNSEYSHASITFDPELEEVYSFNMRKESFGFVRENKSSFKENFISVFAFFAPKNIVNKLKETVYDFGNHKTTFDLKIFANKIFHINHKASNNEYNQVCSTFVDTVLQSGGINLVGDQKIPAPSDIYNGAKSEPNKIFEVYNGIAPKYDGKKVKRQINYLRTNQDTLSINEACKDLKHAREFVYKVGQLAKKYDANYFIVTDGASGIHNKGNDAVRNARQSQIKWEKKNGADPDEDWSNKFGKYINESNDKMMPVKEEYDTLNIIEESVNSDIYLNIEDLESGKSNVLLVTGYSGSGKSTLSHKLSKDHGYIEAPLDDFDERLVGAAELTEFPIIEEYFKSHKVLDIDYKKEDPYTNKDFIRAHDEFIKWCITKSSPNRKIIIEGIQIYLFVSSDLVKKYPIIIKGTSFSKSMKRRIIRNIKAIDDPKDKFIHFFKTIKNLSNHTGDIKTLRDFKKSVNESFSFVNEDYTFVKYKNKDNLYSKGKELYDSLPKQDKEFLGGHYIDSKNIYYRKIYTSGINITGFGELYIFDSSPNDAILMYAVSPDYRNKGLSNKILNDIFDFCKKDKNIHSIIWRANKNNDASNYLANKYKMKLIHSDDRDNEYSMVFNESFSFVNESNDKSKFEKKYIPKNKLDLNSFKKVKFKDSKSISEYISNNKFLSSKKGQDLINKYADGYIWIDEDNKEPTKKELERIMKNWNNMTEEQKKKSDNESIKLFGITNKENYKKLISSYNESTEISDIYYNDENISERDDYMLEYIQDIKNKVNPFSKKTFYHISFDGNLDEKTLTPRVPSWISRMLEKDKDFIETLDKYNSKDSTTGGGYEEYKTPRVCFSNSIEGCLNAVITMKDRMELAGKQIHVYIPENPIDQYKTKSNKMIQKDGDIFDANITNEMWILEPVKVKYIGSIVVDKVITEKKTKMSNNKKKTLTKYIYKWHWFHKIKYDVSNKSADISDISEGNDLILEAQLPEGVTLRNATQDDTDNMFKWEMESVDKNIRNDPKIIKLIKDDVKKSIHCTKMIMLDNQTIGMFTTEMINNGYFYIGEIYIINKYRDKGIGSTLLKNEIKNHSKCILQVSQSNSSAIKLYKSLGFEVSETNDEQKMYVMKLNRKNKNESVSYFNETKKFPIEFDDSGNLTIYKCRMGNISYGDEIDDSSELLESYRNTNNIEGMKYEVSRLWFIISDIEKKMTKRIDSKKYDEYVRNRATATNIFKHNLEYLMKMDKDFNFAEYYNTTPFSNNSVKITNNTLKYSMKTLQQFIMK